MNGNTRDRFAKELQAWRPLLEQIAEREPALRLASEVELRRRASALKQPLQEGVPLEALIPDGFSIVREAARRAIGQRAYDVQLACGIALVEGRLAEMPTGEGKTLAAVAPVFLHALAGHGVHVLTFNDYLARRDAAWMGPVFGLLGLTVGQVDQESSPAARREAYRCDVTYLSARECGFDQLRDGLCLRPEDQVQRPFHFALVDEADSIMIDEARIPLVVAGGGDPEPVTPERLATIVRTLQEGVDFETDEYRHELALTEAGTERVEALMGWDNLFAPEHVEGLAAVRNALHAEVLLQRDVDYIVREQRVEIVDEFTGRVAEHRHWPDGLQAAVEVKEGLRPSAEGRILASTTLQHLLQGYPVLSGMTATASSSADEIRQVYGIEVVEIPSRFPGRRVDLPDRIFVDRSARDRALIEEIVALHAESRPVLVGTANVRESERLARRLAERGLGCRILNARNDEAEAAIVAEAGAPGAITISTNMAGRGTDIRLGGTDESERETVVARGGICVIGTHRHESLRIDRQLRGRAGRQGDPGTSRFLLALDDPLLVRYGIRDLIPARHWPEDSWAPIRSPLVLREVERAYRIVDGEYLDLRRRLYAFSDVLDRQRQAIGEWRQSVLEGRAAHERLQGTCPDVWAGRCRRYGERYLREVAQRLTLLVIDRCFSEYLAEMQAVRDEVPLLGFAGKEPLTEFTRIAMEAFEQLERRIDMQIVGEFLDLRFDATGVDWTGSGLRGPAATWSYLIWDPLAEKNALREMSFHPGVAGIGVLTLGPLLLAWGAFEHWRRKKRLRETA